MFVFADLSSPTLDSSTEHLKVEITQDCRPVYWAAIQWQSESSVMLFSVHCSGQAKFFSWSALLGGHWLRQNLTKLLVWWLEHWKKSQWELDLHSGCEQHISLHLPWRWTAWCLDALENKPSVGKEVRMLGIQVNLHKRELSFHNFCMHTFGLNIKPQHWREWPEQSTSYFALDYRSLQLARLHCLFYWFFSIDFQPVTEYCCIIVASTSPSIIVSFSSEVTMIHQIGCHVSLIDAVHKVNDRPINYQLVLFH